MEETNNLLHSLLLYSDKTKSAHGKNSEFLFDEKSQYSYYRKKNTIMLLSFCLGEEK